MNGGYNERYALINSLITREMRKEHARKAGSHTFSRERQLPLLELLVCALSKKGLTTEMEPQNYYESRRKGKCRVSKQGYLQQRKRLAPEVFRYMNQEYLRAF